MRARWLNPLAWWAWAIGLAIMASRSTNPILLALIVTVAAFVVSARRPHAAWGGTFRIFLLLGLAVIAIRVAVGLVLGAPDGGTVLFTLPTLALPGWTGLRFGGDVTASTLIFLVCDGLRLAAVLACIGAANSLASPSRLLKSVPAALYETGVAIVVALTFTPQLAADAQRLRIARRLRGRDTSGVRGFGTVAVPVLEGALERSLHLAAAMDSRGYGRTATQSLARRRLIASAFLGGLMCATVATYAALDERISGLALILLAVASVLLIVGALVIAGRSRVRTVYRRDPWSLPEWVTTAIGVVTATVAVTYPSAALQGPVAVTWPEVPVLAVAAVLACLIPAWATPLPPDRST